MFSEFSCFFPCNFRAQEGKEETKKKTSITMNFRKIVPRLPLTEALVEAKHIKSDNLCNSVQYLRLKVILNKKVRHHKTFELGELIEYLEPGIARY